MSRKPRFSRRAWLAIACGTAVAGVVGWTERKWFTWRARRVQEFFQAPATRIAKHFDYLELDPAGVQAFVDAWIRHRGPLSRTKAWPSEVYTRYLLSTDFFVHDADERRVVRFVAFYDPYVTACSNPLARFDE